MYYAMPIVKYIPFCTSDVWNIQTDVIMHCGEMQNRFAIFDVHPKEKDEDSMSVSYTHLDVYKRQGLWYALHSGNSVWL